MSSTDDRVLRYLVGKPNIFEDVCLIYSPLIKEIAAEGISNFYKYISLLTIHKPEGKKIRDAEVREQMEKLSDFQYLLFVCASDAELMKTLVRGLEFFTKEKALASIKTEQIFLGEPEEKRVIDERVFYKFQEEIKLACALRDTSEQDIELLETDTEQVRALKMKLLEGRRIREEKKAKHDEAQSKILFSDLVASLPLAQVGLNILTVQDISYYALQDQLRRSGWKEEFEINTRASLAGAKIDKKKMSYWIRNMSFK